MSRECSASSHTKMLVLAQRKSTSTTSYFRSRVELTLNTLPSGAVGQGHILGLLGSLEVSRVFGWGVEALVGQLLHVRNERFV
jgi:hypothetical protein